MDAIGSVEMAVFGEFRLDLRGGGLFRCVEGDRLVPVSIGSRALAVLGMLVERPGELLSKDEIIATVWLGTVVEEANLSVQLSKLRRILDADLDGASHIQTVPGRGYRFARPVTRRPMPGRTTEPTSIEEHPLSVGVTTLEAGPRRRLPAGSIISAATILLVILTVGLAWRLNHLNPPRPAAYSAQDRRRSVMVLPFENSSGDPAQDSLAAEVTREVTDIIATDDGVPIVSSASTAISQGASVNLRSIGREYDVHFVLSGHMRRQDGHLVIVATLFHTYNERSVWTQQYDSPDRPAALRSIIQSIGDAFDDATEDAESARAKIEHPNDLDKRDLLFAANAVSLWHGSRENYLARIALVDRALALDPNFIWALRKSGMLRAELVLSGFSSDRDADLSVATRAADRALMLSPYDVSVLRTKATVLRARNDWKGAEALLRKLIALQPMVAEIRSELAQVLMEEGRHKEALESLMTAQELLAPNDSGQFLHSDMAAALVANERYAEAIAPARLAISESPLETGIGGERAWLALIAAEIENGQDAEGRADLRKFLDTPRHLRNLAEVKKIYYFATNEKLLDGLRRAGMPPD